jgi:preprotein translocase subunit YajC
MLSILAQQAQPAGGVAGLIIPIVLMIGVFYFLLIRPQQKKQKEHQAMLDAIKTGDEVVTRGGLVGKVSGVQDNMLIIELQERVRVRVLKSYVDAKLTPGAQASSATSAATSR